MLYLKHKIASAHVNIQWRRGGGREQGAMALKFSTVEKLLNTFFPIVKVLPRNAKFRAKNPICEIFEVTLKF